MNGKVIPQFFHIKLQSLFLHSPIDLPDPVTNCTAYNATAYTMQFTCVPGHDGGIKQSFFVEVINCAAHNIISFLTLSCFVTLQVFDGKEKIFNVSSEHPTFLLRKLPSDTKLVVRVSNHF